MQVPASLHLHVLQALPRHWHSLQDQMAAYVQLLVRELEASQRLNEGPLQTVFFGGGALGLLPPGLVCIIS